MKNVKILSSTDAYELENAINKFIAGKKLIDIKYNPVFAINKIEAIIVDRVLIIYED
nr:MAG TPA: Sporulation protein Cse60 [Bacteriophage sp.]